MFRSVLAALAAIGSLTAGGCLRTGAVGVLPDGALADAPAVGADGSSDSAVVDAGSPDLPGFPDLPGPPTCSPFGALAVVTPVDSSSDDWAPTITADGLQLVFGSWRAGGAGSQDLWTATRASAADPFGAPVPLTELNTGADDRSPAISGDGLELFFVSGRPGSLGNSAVWRAARSTVGDAFSAPTRIAALDSGSFEDGPQLSADGLTLYFCRAVGGAVGYQLLRATRSAVGQPFGGPALIDELNTTADERAPAISPDDLALYFSSDRPGGKGGSDLWVARRPDPGAPFGPAEPVAELNSADRDGDFVLAADGQTAYFARDTGGAGGSEIWTATRSCPPAP